jgi:hypothetical protein
MLVMKLFELPNHEVIFQVTEFIQEEVQPVLALYADKMGAIQDTLQI